MIAFIDTMNIVMFVFVNILPDNNIKVWHLVLLVCIFTSPAEALVRCCDEHVYLSVCESVCLTNRIPPEPHMRFLQIFSARVAYGHGLALLRQGDEEEGAVLGVFHPIDNAL